MNLQEALAISERTGRFITRAGKKIWRRHPMTKSDLACLTEIDIAAADWEMVQHSTPMVIHQQGCDHVPNYTPTSPVPTVEPGFVQTFKFVQLVMKQEEEELEKEMVK